MRLKGGDVTVFTLGGTSLVGVLEEVNVSSTVGDEDGAGINEIDEDPEAVSRARQITGSAFVDDGPAFMAIVEGPNPVVTFSMAVGGVTYAGSALITQAEHQMRRKALQKERFTLKVKGQMTVTEAA